LFGHEIVAVAVGVVWGLGVGFAIVALGTLLGECANFLSVTPMLPRHLTNLAPAAFSDSSVAVAQKNTRRKVSATAYSHTSFVKAASWLSS